MSASFTVHIFRCDIPLSPFITIPLLGCVGGLAAVLCIQIVLRCLISGSSSRDITCEILFCVPSTLPLIPQRTTSPKPLL